MGLGTRTHDLRPIPANHSHYLRFTKLELESGIPLRALQASRRKVTPRLAMSFRLTFSVDSRVHVSRDLEKLLVAQDGGQLKIEYTVTEDHGRGAGERVVK